MFLSRKQVPGVRGQSRVRKGRKEKTQEKAKLDKKDAKNKYPSMSAPGDDRHPSAGSDKGGCAIVTCRPYGCKPGSCFPIHCPSFCFFCFFAFLFTEVAFFPNRGKKKIKRYHISPVNEENGIADSSDFFYFFDLWVCYFWTFFFLPQPLRCGRNTGRMSTSRGI